MQKEKQEAMIELKNVSKTFHRGRQSFKALENINLKVNRGDILGIIGFSGAGKSTLIRCVNLLEKPDTGEVIVNGKDLMPLKANELAQERKKIGMIFQHFNLLSSRTVFQNVALPLELDGLDKATIAQKVNKLLVTVGLHEKANDYPRSLSGGQKQRVAIARALANDPHLLLCDEATSALDPLTTQSILQLLKDINQQLKITILLITHEMEVVKSICNNVAVIDRGELLAKGTLEQLYRERSHPIIAQLIAGKGLEIPQELRAVLSEKADSGLSPLIEMELNSEIKVEQILDFIHLKKVPYKLFKVDIGQTGILDFGKLQLHLRGSSEENNIIFNYLDTRNVQYIIRGYA